MNTIFLYDKYIQTIDFKDLSKGKQIIVSKSGTDYDKHQIMYLEQIFLDCLYIFSSVTVDRIICRQYTEAYLNIANETLHLKSFREIKKYQLKREIIDSIKNSKNTGKLVCNDKTKNIWFCGIKVYNDIYIIIETIIDIDETEIVTNHVFTITDFLNSYRFNCNNSDELFGLIEKLGSDDFNKYKDKLLSVINYSIDDFIQGMPPDKFLNLFNSDIINKYFEPVFKHEKFEIYIDYDKVELACYYNKKKIGNNIAPDYLRIRDSLENHLFYHASRINPFNGEIIISGDGLGECEIEYSDAEGLITSEPIMEMGANQYYERTKEVIYKRIHGIYVLASSSEVVDIKSRKKVLDTLTN